MGLGLSRLCDLLEQLIGRLEDQTKEVDAQSAATENILRNLLELWPVFGPVLEYDPSYDKQREAQEETARYLEQLCREKYNFHQMWATDLYVSLPKKMKLSIYRAIYMWHARNFIANEKVVILKPEEATWK